MNGMCGISNMGIERYGGICRLFAMVCRPFGIDGINPIVMLCRPFGTLRLDSPKGTTYHRIGFQSNYYKNINHN
jgi:hypothetical protein